MDIVRKTVVTLTENDIREAVIEWLDRKLTSFQYIDEPSVVFKGSNMIGSPIAAEVSATHETSL